MTIGPLDRPRCKALRVNVAYDRAVKIQVAGQIRRKPIA